MKISMKTLGTLVLALSMLASATPALASTNSAFTDKYTATSNSPYGGQWTCAGTRVENKNKIEDIFTCTVSDPTTLPAGTYTNDNAPFGWLSDYKTYAADSFTLNVNQNGHVIGKAFYVIR
jgi:hypothetical protein